MVLLLVLSMSVTACDPVVAPTPPAFEGCGVLTATVTGRFNNVSGTIRTTATVNDTGRDVTWDAVAADDDNGTGTGLAIDGFSSQGQISEDSPRTFTATGTSTGVLKHKIRVTGTITGSPPECIVTDGQWFITTSSGRFVGSGRWSIP